MEYNFLAPKCGLKVSAICLGTMTMKKTGTSVYSKWGTDETTSYKILDRFVELGGNFIDTADIYEAGETEKIIGEWMKKKGNREDMVIATKCRWDIHKQSKPEDTKKPNTHGLSRKHIIEAVEGSLTRLQTHYIDLYQINGPDMGTPLKETLRTLDDLVKSGKIRYVGACNMKGWQMQKIVDIGKELGLNPFVTLQQHYSLLDRTSEEEAFEVCLNEGLGVLPWSPLKGGLLTGKYTKGKHAPTGTRLEKAATHKLDTDSTPDYEKYVTNEKFCYLLNVMDKIAKYHGKTTTQVALRWLLQTPTVSSVIIGTTKVQQLEENMGALGWTLTTDEIKELDTITKPTTTTVHTTMEMLTDGRKNVPFFH